MPRFDEMAMMPDNVTMADIKSGRFRERTRQLYPHLPTVIRRTAKELAGAFFETGVRSNNFRMAWPSVRDYVRDCWPLYVKDARKLLSKMLGAKNVTKHQKNIIYDALMSEDRR